MSKIQNNRLEFSNITVGSTTKEYLSVHVFPEELPPGNPLDLKTVFQLIQTEVQIINGAIGK
jgi:hypothetical protein